MAIPKKISKPVAPKGAGAGLRAKNIRTGGFLDDIDVEVTGSRFTIDEFEGTDFKTGERGTIRKNVLRLDLESPDKANIRPKDWSVGQWVPSYDGETPAEHEEGWDPEVGAQFLCDPKGGPCTGISGQSAGGVLINRLTGDCGWDDSRFDDIGAEAFLGLKGHTREITVPNKDKKKKPMEVTIFERIDNQKSGSAKEGDKKAASVKPAAVVGKAKVKPAPEPEEPEEEQPEDEPDTSALDDAEQRANMVSSIIASALSKNKGKPFTKSQLPALINRDKDLADMDMSEKSELAKLAVSDTFLKAGAKDGVWTWDGRQVGPVGE